MKSENESENRETVADIVRDMRSMYFNHDDDTRVGIVLLKRYADRIDAAHAREIGNVCEYALPNGGCAVVQVQRNKVQRLRNENARMRKALEDVLAVRLYDGGTQRISNSMCAIAKAQAIMKGETK